MSFFITILAEVTFWSLFLVVSLEYLRRQNKNKQMLLRTTSVGTKTLDLDRKKDYGFSNAVDGNRNTYERDLSTTSDDYEQVVRARVYSRRVADQKYIAELRRELRSMKKGETNSAEYNRMQQKYYESLRISKTSDSDKRNDSGASNEVNDGNANTTGKMVFRTFILPLR